MLMIMCCTLYSLILFFVWNDILVALVFKDAYCSEPQPWYLTWPDFYISWLPSYFLGVGCMLNLNKWVYFAMRIRAFINVGRGMHELDNE